MLSDIIHLLASFLQIFLAMLVIFLTYLAVPFSNLKKTMATWRVIPVSEWLIAMINKSPSWGYALSKWPKQSIKGLLTTYYYWDDSPSREEISAS